MTYPVQGARAAHIVRQTLRASEKPSYDDYFPHTAEPHGLQLGPIAVIAGLAAALGLALTAAALF